MQYIFMVSTLIVMTACGNTKFSAPGAKTSPKPAVHKSLEATFPKNYNLIAIANFPLNDSHANYKVIRPLMAELESFAAMQKVKGDTVNLVREDIKYQWKDHIGGYPDLAAKICPSNQSKIVSTFIHKFNNGSGNYADLTYPDELQICLRTVRNDKNQPVFMLSFDPKLMTRIVENGLVEQIDQKLPTLLLLFLGVDSRPDNETRIYDLNWLAEIILELEKQGTGKLKPVLIHDINRTKCDLYSFNFIEQRNVQSQTIPHVGSFLEKTKGSQIDICDPAWTDKLAGVLNSQ